MSKNNLIKSIILSILSKHNIWWEVKVSSRLFLRYISVFIYLLLRSASISLL